MKSGLNAIKALTKVTKKNQTSLYLLVSVQFIKTNFCLKITLQGHLKCCSHMPTNGL